ncbi:hypothetical protein DERF_014512 [Dermatophagoides farinae]|uniref:Glutathione S-transferase 1-like n=1 Tax=Dermatophagoides farinae TaxID=6954 RepID=A0A922KT68_DERFA|nr:glutathione S-transferase 1-like [Dermatophagoides farinae]KAH9493783.1 hypothetical protein DERF_014512 [Dermatophagoides farinae]
MKPIDLYVAPPSPTSRAVIIAARYMHINVKLIIIDLMKGEQKEDWFVKMNPQHCLPTINDNGFILWESRAIMTYMANKYAPNNPIYPMDPKQRGRVDCLLQYDLNVLNRAITDLMIPLRRSNKMNQKNNQRQSSTKFLNTIKERKVNEALEYLESILINNHYLIDNHLTLADFSVYCSLEFAEKYHYNLSRYQNLHQYFERLKQILCGLLYFPNDNIGNLDTRWIQLNNDNNHNNNNNDGNNDHHHRYEHQQQQQPLSSNNNYLLYDDNRNNQLTFESTTATSTANFDFNLNSNNNNNNNNNGHN